MVRVAVVGCAHGMLDDIFATVRFINDMDTANPIELLLCCGDFECMRNSRDLANLACPPKYREMHSFHEYYARKKVAPVLTIFIGGNHEASNYLSELHYGGWVAPNIFYLGAAGVINVAGLRIAGLSGIYKQQDYTAGRFERAPFDNSTMRSIYHVRELDVFQLSHVQQTDKTPLSAFLSHDWPRGIEQFGDVRALIRRKPFFQQEIQTNSLGSPAGELLLYQLQPQHWFAAHLHVKFAALVRHPLPVVTAPPVATEPVPSGALDTPPSVPPAARITKFLALDKCLPRREFLQVVDIGSPRTTDSLRAQPLTVDMDFEWLAILRATHHLASTQRHAPRVPLAELTITQADIQWVAQRYQEVVVSKNLQKTNREWLSDFIATAPAFGLDEQQWDGRGYRGNPQTDLLLEFLKLPHVFTAPYVGHLDADRMEKVDDPNAIELEDEEENDEENDEENEEENEEVNEEEKVKESEDDDDDDEKAIVKEPVRVENEKAENEEEKVATGDPNELDIDM